MQTQLGTAGLIGVLCAVVGVLNLLLAALMGFGALMALIFIPDAWLAFDKEPEDFFILIFLCLYAASGGAAALSVGFVWLERTKRVSRLPLIVHLTSGLFLSINICLVLAGLVTWHSHGVGVSADVEIVIVLVPLLVVGPSYAFLLARQARSSVSPTP